tara:strand:- start:246 stop:725 length:480 start_codon:yes stop_codon:yes gene_type:complete
VNLQYFTTTNTGRASIIAALITALIIGNSPKAQAASEDECAIWICLPGGFPAGCGAAHSAMLKRLKDRKAPLPAFGSCAANAPATTYDWGTEVEWICPTGFNLAGTGGRDDERYCVGLRLNGRDGGYQTAPARARSKIWVRIFSENTTSNGDRYETYLN